MRVKLIYTGFNLAVLILLNSCSTNSFPEQQPSHEEKINTGAFPDFDEKASQIATPGVVGVYRVPAALVFAYTDSASLPSVAKKVSEAYTLIGEELKSTGAVLLGALGQMMYNNDSANFKFTCLAPILQSPTRQPVKCQLMTLNTADMLVYNYYGPYQQLHIGYSEMRGYLKAQSLEQAGPLREFYLTNPTQESDSSKWLTRIMVPVVRNPNSVKE